MGKQKKNFAVKALKNLSTRVKGETEVQSFVKTASYLLNIAEVLDKHHTYDAVVVMKAKGMPKIKWGRDIMEKAHKGEDIAPFNYKKKYKMSVEVTRLPVPEEKVVSENSTD